MASTTPDPTEPDSGTSQGNETPPSPPIDSPDPMAWAESFVQHVQAYPGIPTDAGTMVGWFANAMAASDRAKAARFTPAECSGTKGGCQRWAYGDILHRHWTDTSTGMDVITPGDTPPGVLA